MQVNGSTYGIIPDTFNTILNNYLTPLVNTFPNATDPSSPAYTICYLTAGMDQILQASLVSLWNAVNANTAQGLGLDILASTILNLSRPGLQPSTLQVQVDIGPIYSMCQVQVTVTANTGPVTFSGAIPATGSTTQATGGVTTTAGYYLQTVPAPITTPGVYYYNFFSTDTTTQIPTGNFTGLTNVTGTVTYTVTNIIPGTLGSLTIPTTWYATSTNVFDDTMVPFPKYYPNTALTFTTEGNYNFLVYSTDITTIVGAGQINFASDYFNGTIKSVTNLFQNILGSPALTDAQFSALRRYYLNVEGQTYYGLEKAIIDLKIDGLDAVDIAETISETSNYSILVVKFVIDVTGGPITLPANLQVLGTATPSNEYHLLESYAYPMGGSPITVYLPTYSTDLTTPVGIATISSTNPVIAQVTVSNLVPAVLGQTLVPDGLGQRGYTVYLEYNTLELNVLTAIINVTTIGLSPPYTIPVGWTATGGVPTTSPYVTRQSYPITALGNVTIQLYSQDTTTVIPVNNFTGGDDIAGIGAFTISNAAGASLTEGFDILDPNLQLIALTAFEYHPLGTQFYPAAIGATEFVVDTPYAGYTSVVILNPFQTVDVFVNLQLIYNANPADAGYSNGVFNPLDYPTLQTDIQGLINTYFLSKTLPTDLFYYINEIEKIIQATYPGIVSLVGNPTVYSVCQIQLTVTAGTTPQTLPVGWTATGGVVTSAPYVTQQAITIPANGTYFFNVYSTDITTPVPPANFTGGTPSEGLTYTATNSAAASLGSDIIKSSFLFSVDGIAWLPYLSRVIGTKFFLPNVNFIFSSIDKDSL